LLVPKDWRPEGGPTQFMVIPWPFDKEQADYLSVLPVELYAKICRHVAEHSLFNDSMSAFKRAMASSAKKVEFDKFGRIALSQTLLEEAGIQDEAALVGVVDHFEIWQPERFRAIRPIDKQTAAQVKPSFPI